MKVTTEILVTEFKTKCPHCEEIEDGWFANPRGEETECGFCEKPYKVHEEADLVEG